MTARILFIISGIWFAAAVAWSFSGFMFFVPLGSGKVARWVGTALASGLAYLGYFVMLGWIVPLVAAIVLVLKHR
jgi:hypothetical protein